MSERPLIGIFSTPVQESRDYDPENARTFYGNGQTKLPVKNLLNVERVFIDGVELPSRLPIKAPRNAQHSEFVEFDMQGFALDFESDTQEPFLVRCSSSNDGIWQNGSKIVVIGEWKQKRAPAAVKE